jgi:hypothetical protein
LRFRAGTYEWQWEPAEFDMAEHNKLLVDTADEVKEMRARQAKAQKEMTAAEADSLARWREEKAQNKVDVSSIETMLNGTNSSPDAHHIKQYVKIILTLYLQILPSAASMHRLRRTSGKCRWKLAKLSLRARQLPSLKP